MYLFEIIVLFLHCDYLLLHTLNSAPYTRHFHWQITNLFYLPKPVWAVDAVPKAGVLALGNNPLACACEEGNSVVPEAVPKGGVLPNVEPAGLPNSWDWPNGFWVAVPNPAIMKQIKDNISRLSNTLCSCSLNIMK